MGKVTLKVELICCTPNAEKLVAAASRLCYSDADLDALRQGVEARDQTRFLQKLVDMGHLSPIEHATYTFGVEGVSRSLLAQVTRHRMASFSVKSQRYVGAQSKDGQTFNYMVPRGIEALGPEAVAEFEAQMSVIQGWYDGWVERLGAGESGFEDARFVLPNAAETKLIFTMNARELHHFFAIRCCNRAQWEIRELAWQMLALVKKEAPGLFDKAGPGCIGGPCPEGRMACGKSAEVRARYKDQFGE